MSMTFAGIKRKKFAEIAMQNLLYFHDFFIVNNFVFTFPWDTVGGNNVSQ